MMENDNAMEWWRGLFASPFWGAAHSSIAQEQTAAELDDIIRLLGLSEGDAILDVPCGEGRHTVELAARGYRVTGLDLSRPLLDAARDRAARRGVAVEWVEGDMRRIGRQAEFDGAICYWGSFGYFDDGGNLEFLQEAARALRPGGRMIIDTHIMETLLRVFTPRGWNRMGDVHLIEERRFDHVRGRVETDWTLIRSGAIEEWSSSIRIYSYRQLAELLAEAGFSRSEGFDPTTGRPFVLGSPRLAMVATR